MKDFVPKDSLGAKMLRIRTFDYLDKNLWVLKILREITMDTVELIIKAYTEVAAGMKRIDLQNDEGVTVKAYQAGTIIRIDIKEE